MLVSEHLKFDVDNEVDALNKTRRFVADVCKPIIELPKSLQPEQ